MEKTFYDPLEPLSPWPTIRKLTTGQGGGYTTGCLLDYEYIKNHYKLIAVDLSIQKELDADPKPIQQIEFFRQLKNSNNKIVANESMFVLTILEKVKEITCSAKLRSDDVLRTTKKDLLWTFPYGLLCNGMGRPLPKLSGRPLPTSFEC